MKQQYIDILESIEKMFDTIDSDEFLNEFLRLQASSVGPTIDEFIGKHMILEKEDFVYSVGEFCQHEGGGWSVLVANNENTFANIQKVLIDHHEEQAAQYERWVKEDEEEEDINSLSWHKDIEGHNSIAHLVKNATCIKDINNKEIPPYNHDVIRITKKTIIS